MSPVILASGIIAAGLALAAVFFYLITKPRTHGRVVYSDASRKKLPPRVLRNPELGLTGKPDYLYEENGKIVPVEFKSSSYDSPADHHVYQLGAYALLVDHEFGNTAEYGILRYGNGREWKIPLTGELREAVRARVRRMRTELSAPRNHHDVRRCRACKFREACREKL